MAPLELLDEQYMPGTDGKFSTVAKTTERCTPTGAIHDTGEDGWDWRSPTMDDDAERTRAAEDAAARFEIAAATADGVLTSDLRSVPTQFPECLCKRCDDRTKDASVIINVREYRNS